LHPDALSEGLNAIQKNSKEIDQSSFDQINILDKQISSTKAKSDKLIDLYLNNQLPKELLISKRDTLEDALKTIRTKRSELQSNLQSNDMTDEQILDLEEFAHQSP
jgi:chromosome segregation ATPase